MVSTELEPGESVVVEAVVRNRGSAAGEWEIELAVAATLPATESVTLDPGEETTVRFSRPVRTAGTYEVAVADAARTVRVERRGGDEETAFETTDEEGSGFGALAALLGAPVRRSRAPYGIGVREGHPEAIGRR